MSVGGYSHVYGLWNKSGKASFALFACSVGFGVMAWIVDIFGPEQGGIRIGEDVDYANGNGKTKNLKSKAKITSRSRSRSRSGGYQEVASDDEDVIAEEDGEDDHVENGSGKRDIGEKIALEHAESPVLKANIYSRLTFGFLTRELYRSAVSVGSKNLIHLYLIQH